MTINVGLVTNDALVVGCDSISSAVAPMVDPFAQDFARDQNGDVLKDANGNPLMPIHGGAIQRVVTNVMTGVTKMFPISKNPDVVAVTAGLAKLNNRTMNALAEEFREKLGNRKQQLVNVEPIAKEFLRFMRHQHEEHYKGSSVPEQYQESAQFLVGGYGRDDAFPTLCRLDVGGNKLDTEFTSGAAGVSWNGQADSVERLIRGYDSRLPPIIEGEVERAFEHHHEQMRDALIRIVSDILDYYNVDLPQSIDTSIPTWTKGNFSWDRFSLSIDFSNMPTQNAIDFVSWLVLMQSGRFKFARELPTVGGQTHIGVVTRSDGFRMIDEPDLQHRYTGFSHDL